MIHWYLRLTAESWLIRSLGLTSLLHIYVISRWVCQLDSKFKIWMNIEWRNTHFRLFCGCSCCCYFVLKWNWSVWTFGLVGWVVFFSFSLSLSLSSSVSFLYSYVSFVWVMERSWWAKLVNQALMSLWDRFGFTFQVETINSIDFIVSV